MGIMSTKCESLFTRPSKRPRTENQQLTQNILCAKQQNDPDWKNLPYVVLLEIYQLVPTKDKFNMSLTCKAWLMPFSQPSIWRRGYFRFNGVEDWRSIFFVCKTGYGLRHVTVDCSAVAATDSKMVEITDVTSFSNLTDLVNILMTSKNKSLVTFEVTNMLRFAALFKTFNIIDLLQSLLKKQTNLCTLGLINSGLTSDQSTMLLGAACANSGAKLRHVQILEYSILTDYLHESDRFLCFIETLSNLSELSLSYAFLSDDLLFLLSRPTSERLKVIKVWVSHSSLMDSKTSPEAWQCLVTRCPSLRAEYIIWGRSDDESLCNILSQTLPLSYLFWDNGHIMDSINTKSCLTYIRSSFQNHLQQLHLKFPGKVTIDQELADIVERCSKLEILTIKSIYLTHPQETPLVRAIRRVVNSQPTIQLKHFVINNVDIELRETTLTLFIDWILDLLQ